MRDLLLRALLVVRTSNTNISRGHLAGYYHFKAEENTLIQYQTLNYITEATRKSIKPEGEKWLQVVNIHFFMF